MRQLSELTARLDECDHDCEVLVVAVKCKLCGEIIQTQFRDSPVGIQQPILEAVKRWSELKRVCNHSHGHWKHFSCEQRDKWVCSWCFNVFVDKPENARDIQKDI